MSLVVVDVEYVEKNIVKELALYIDGAVYGYSFKPPKNFQPTKQAHWVTENLHGIEWKSGQLDYESIPRILNIVKLQRAEVFAKGQEKCKVVANLLNMHVENLDDYGCPKIQQFQPEQMGFCISYPLRHRSRFHCAEKKVRAYGNWMKQHLKL